MRTLIAASLVVAGIILGMQYKNYLNIQEVKMEVYRLADSAGIKPTSSLYKKRCGWIDVNMPIERYKVVQDDILTGNVKKTKKGFSMEVCL